MNKTITINLAGINFYIDEDAYAQLKQYLENIAASLDAESRAETLQDIESRIAELFLQEQHHKSQVIREKEIDRIIEIMGQPEDYDIDEGTQKSKSSSKKQDPEPIKKLYRDMDNSVVGGVLAGLSHYFGISLFWLRIIFILLILASYSSVILVYIILWIAAPAAKTTSEKLEMKGERVDIGNIERKVREEYENIKNKVDQTDYSEFQNFVNKLGQILLNLLKIIGVFIGFLFAITGLAGIGGAIFGFLKNGFTTLSLFDMELVGIYENLGFLSSLLLSTAVVILVIVPFVLLFFMGVKLIRPQVKNVNLKVVLSLIGLWIIALITLLLYSPWTKHLSQQYYTNYDNTEIAVQDTLEIKRATVNFNWNTDENYKYKNGKTYSNEIKFQLKPTQTEDKVQVFSDLRLFGINELGVDDLKYKFDYKNDTLKLNDYNFIKYDASKVLYAKNTVSIYLKDSIVFKVDEKFRNKFKDLSEEFYGKNLQFAAGVINCLDCSTKEKQNQQTDSIP